MNSSPRPSVTGPSRRLSLTLLALVAICAGLESPELRAAPAADSAPLGAADFRYALPWWQSAICLPDAADKVLVGKEGQVLLDYRKVKEEFNAPASVRRRWFATNLQPDIAEGTRWIRQQTLSPRTPVVQTWKDADGVEVLEETFVVTPGSRPAGTDEQTVVLVTLRNPTAKPVSRQPILRVLSAVPVAWSQDDNRLRLGDGTSVTASEKFAPPDAPLGEETVLRLPAVALPPGESRQVAFTVDRHAATPTPALTVGQARALRDAAQHWWESADLPYATVQVPDAGIQAMLESCVRNIWQAREIKDGLPAFHVGPTIYRGLWMVDGSFLLETAAMLGRAHDARAGLDYMLARQKLDGSFDRQGNHWKENGIVLWAVTRHAVLTQDRAWLRERWPVLQRVVQAIKNLRAKTATDPGALDHGLMPGGFVDGGINNRKEKLPEYSSTYWTLTGLKAAIAAARWLGKDEDVTAWETEYDRLYAALRRAMARDTRQDAQGNNYVPMMMGNAGELSPQKGQWSFCHAVYPGRIFPANDPLVTSQLAMLRATEVQGMVFDTGMVKNGIWTYFASFYGHAQLWLGHSREAAQVLYDFARHAAPVRAWREEQMPVGQGGEELGDMPHNWASAEFIRLATHLLEFDRGDELHLLEGFPREWAGPGMVTRLNGVLTPFGPLHLEVRVAGDGRQATIKMAKLTARPPAKLVLHLAGLTGEARTVELPVDRDVNLTFSP